MEEGGEARLDKIVSATTVDEDDHLMVCDGSIEVECFQCRHIGQGIQANLRSRE